MPKRFGIRKAYSMRRTATVESAIRAELLRQNPCPLETLIERLSQFSWSEVFTVVDQLSRQGQLVLRHPSRFDYEVSIGPSQPTPEQFEERSDTEGNRPAGRGNPNQYPQVYEELTVA